MSRKRVPQRDFRIPEPRPLPDSIRTIADLTFQQKAADAWNSASLLRRLMERWQEWHHDLKNIGDADPGVLIVLQEKACACVRGLYRVGANIAMLQEKSADELVSMFPPLQLGMLMRFDENSGHIPAPWQQEPTFRKAMSDTFRRPEWTRLHRELMGFMRDMEAAPSAAFVEPAKRKRIKEPGKVNGTKKRLENSTKETDKHKLQIYSYIQTQHNADKKPAAILAELKASKDRLDQIKKAGLKADKAMVRAAINLPKERERELKRKKQESPSS